MKKIIGILMVSLIFSGCCSAPNTADDNTKEVIDSSKTGLTRLVDDAIDVYPEDLGYVTYDQAAQICDSVNAQNLYEHNDWRLPTEDELFLILRNKEKVAGLVDDYYLSGAQMINEWGKTIGYLVLDMERGHHRWSRDGENYEDYLPIDGKANLRLVRYAEKVNPRLVRYGGK
ncbi:MAG: DUF1566 domain-containing protein [Bacteroidales bacterium]|jgi:hypothetical protein|nr:DUF1566 domain-containing protein [Bacteroidales bacterium]